MPACVAVTAQVPEVAAAVTTPVALSMVQEPVALKVTGVALAVAVQVPVVLILIIAGQVKSTVWLSLVTITVLVVDAGL